MPLPGCSSPWRFSRSTPSHFLGAALFATLSVPRAGDSAAGLSWFQDTPGDADCGPGNPPGGGRSGKGDTQDGDSGSTDLPDAGPP